MDYWDYWGSLDPTLRTMDLRSTAKKSEMHLSHEIAFVKNFSLF